MEKQKQKALPKETPEERPALFVAVYEFRGLYTIPGNGVFLAKGSGRVAVRGTPYWEDAKRIYTPLEVGTYFEGLPQGPKYTGPIDDEMMANILIYG